jgi:RiboL-PSP-HEPN
MKIRSKEELIDSMTADLGWRKKELTSLYGNVMTSNIKNLPLALRCAVVMLYAHWEGFIKNSAESYLAYVKFQGLNLNQVNSNILALSLRQKLNEFSQTNKATLHVEFVSYFKNNLSDKAKFSETDSIKTQSNLNSIILKEIFATIGLDIVHYELKSNLIDKQLLTNRNNIAHGNQPPIDKEEYENLHIEIVTMLDRIFTDICNSVVLEHYKVAI